MTVSSAAILKKSMILFLVIAGVYLAKDFLMPLFLGAIFATLFSPLCKSLEQKMVPKFLAVLICIMILLVLLAGIGALVAWQISNLAGDIEQVKQVVADSISRIQNYILINLGITAKEQTQFLKDQHSVVMSMISMIAGSLTAIFINFMLIMVYIFLFLFYRAHILDFFLRLFPADQQKKAEEVMYNITHVSQQYLLGLNKMIVCLWVMYYIGFSIAGVKHALFFAILCGLLEIVPYVGNITGTTLTVLVSAVNGAGFPMLGGIVLTYGIVQFLQGWVLEPLIVGPQVRINPFATIIALVLGELLWGIPGVILAIPLAAMIKIVCDSTEQLKPYGFLIGEVGPARNTPAFIQKIKAWHNKKFR